MCKAGADSRYYSFMDNRRCILSDSATPGNLFVAYAISNPRRDHPSATRYQERVLHTYCYALFLPADEILKSFEEKAKAIELKIEKCEEEIRELIKLCDLLLPMLVNGQDRVERGKRKDEKHNKIICCI